MLVRYVKCLVLVLALASGCAKPKYINEVVSGAGENLGQEVQAGRCEIQFSTSSLCLVWSWGLKPTSESEGTLIFKTYRLNNLDQTPVETDLIGLPEVILWMPSMGHGSTPTRVERLDVGTYRVNQVFFIMPGEWDIRFQVKNQQQVLDAAQISLSF